MNVDLFIKSIRDPDQAAQQFDQFSATYDVELLEKGFTLPTNGAQLMSQFVPKSAKILDAGCGTGLVAQALLQHGYNDLSGIDISPQSLDIARAKNVYRELLRHNLLESFPFADSCFDAIACIAVFSRFNADDLRAIFSEFQRITKPDGYIIFSYRENLHLDFTLEHILEELPLLPLLYVTPPSQAVTRYEPHQHIMVRYYALQNRKENGDVISQRII